MISDKMNLSRWLRKSIIGISALAMMASVSLADKCLAQDFVGLKMYPEHVGVFTTDGAQQFIVFGVMADGSSKNITDQVDWISSDEDIVTIDENGLATIVAGKTYGQVKITCSYPKTIKYLPHETSMNLLLLHGPSRLKM